MHTRSQHRDSIFSIRIFLPLEGKMWKVWKCLTGIGLKIYIIIPDYSNGCVCGCVSVMCVCICVCVCDSNNMQIINEETIVVDDCRCCNLHALFNTLTHFSYHAAFLEFIFTLQTFQKSKMCWKIERKCRH